jgi:hypothetical protein
VQEAILRWMLVKPGLALSILRPDRHHQHAAKADAQEELAKKVHCASSLLRSSKWRAIAAWRSLRPLSGGVKSAQPSAVILAASPEAIGTLL